MQTRRSNNWRLVVKQSLKAKHPVSSRTSTKPRSAPKANKTTHATTNDNKQHSVAKRPPVRRITALAPSKSLKSLQGKVALEAKQTDKQKHKQKLASVPTVTAPSKRTITPSMRASKRTLKQKRLAFARAHRKDDFRSWLWWDDMSLEIPPRLPNPFSCPQYRFPGSTTPLYPYPPAGTVQLPVLFMGVGVSYSGKTTPVFNVQPAATPTASHKLDTFYMDQHTFVERLDSTIFPFMKNHKLSKLFLNNNPIQIAEGVCEHIAASSFQTVGNNSAKMRHPWRDPHGVPPKSPDLSVLNGCVFYEFMQKYRMYNPRTVEKAIEVATRLWNEMDQQVIREYIDTYAQRLGEVVKKKGGNTRYKHD